VDLVASLLRKASKDCWSCGREAGVTRGIHKKCESLGGAFFGGIFGGILKWLINLIIYQGPSAIYIK